jgi:hypothetical protein
MALKKLIGGLCVALALGLALVPLTEAGRSGGVHRDNGTLQPGFPVYGQVFTYKANEPASFMARTNNPANPLSVLVKSTPGGKTVGSGTTGADGTVTVNWSPASKTQKVQNFYITVTNVGSTKTGFSLSTN